MNIMYIRFGHTMYEQRGLQDAIARTKFLHLKKSGKTINYKRNRIRHYRQRKMDQKRRTGR